MLFEYNLGVIGFGNMANAITGGIIKSGACPKEKILVYDVSADKLSEAKAKGFKVADGISDIALKCNYILLSVKPQSSGAVFAEIGNKLSGNIIISIMAGVSKSKIHSGLKNVKVCRCMPNTPALAGKGMTAVDASELSPDEKEFALKIFSSVGNAIELEEEYLNAVTAVSGSGPAYVYLFIKSFIEGAVKLGFTYGQAKNLVLSTVEGSAEMVKESNEDISLLIDRVCSKGGTTIEGVKVMQAQNIGKTMQDCVEAAFKRAEELSKI